jgi:hypothetical protein
MNTLEIQKTIDYIYLQIERIADDIYHYEERTGGDRNLELERVRREYGEELFLYLKLLELSIVNEDE